MAQLAQRFRFDLTDAFAGDRERVAHFFKRVFGTILQAKAHLDDFFFARRQRLQQRRRLFLKTDADSSVRGRYGRLVLDKFAQVRIFLLANGSLPRDRLLCDLPGLAHRVGRNAQAFGDFLGIRFTAQLLHELPAGPELLVDGLNHVHGDADCASLVRDGARYRLADPPRRIRRKFIAAPPLEFVRALHEPDIAFLNQVQELQSAVRIFLRDGDDQAQVGLDHFLLGLVRFGFSPEPHLEHSFQVGQPRFAGNFNFAQLGAACAQLLARFGGVIALRGLGTAFEFDGFALQRLQPLDSIANLAYQPLLLERMEFNRSYQLRHSHSRASQAVPVPQVNSLFGPRDPLELSRLLERYVIKLLDLPNDSKNFAGLILSFFFGQLFLVELNNFLDR